MSVSEGGLVRHRLRVSSAPYLSFLLVAPVAYQFGLTVAGGSSLGPLLLVAFMAAAIVTGLLARSTGDWSGLVRAWLLLAIFQWLYLVMSEGAGGVQTDAAAVFVPIGLLLILIKRPNRRSAWAASDALAWSLVATSVVALVLEVVGLVPSWYESLGGYFLDLAEFDKDAHWLTLNSALGMDGRWGGILRDPNAIGPVGALLAVYGFARPGLRRIAFVAAGGAIVVLADSRATYGALAFGLLALLLLPGWGVRLMTVTPAKAAVAVLGLLAATRIGRDVVMQEPGTLTLTGRTEMWPDFLSLWPQSPIFGVGTATINAAQESGILPAWSSHGHNQYLDTLVRYGLVGIVLSCSLLLVGLVVAGLAARNGRGLSMALLVVLVITMTANFFLDWRYPSIALSWVLIVVILGGTTPAVTKDGPRSLRGAQA